MASRHDGHRQRVKARFLNSDLDGFDDLSILEFLLFYALPRRDTAPMARQLLERYGSLPAVMEAPLKELQSVDGITENAATLLRLIPAVARQYMIRRNRTHEPLDTAEKYGAYLLPRFFGERDEVVWLLSLDTKMAPADCRLLFRGNVNTAGVSVRKVLEVALACSATAVVLAHNHTGGLALPSREDVETTKRLCAALETVGIQLYDHIVVAGDDFVSMAESNLIP